MLLAVDVRSTPHSAPLPKLLQLRRIFGADVVQSVDRQELAEAANRRRQAMGLRGVPASRRRPLRKGVLVAPKDHWPPFDGGLSMEIVGEQWQRGRGAREGGDQGGNMNGGGV